MWTTRSLLILALLGVASCGNGGDPLAETESLLDGRRFVEARDRLVASQGDTPASARAAVLLARAERECGDAEAARRALSKIRESEANRPEVVEERVRVLLALEEVERALAREHYLGRAARAAALRTAAGKLARSLAEGPRATARTCLLAAEVLSGIKGREGAARSFVDEARRLGGADPGDLAFVRGLLRLRGGDKEGARRTLFEAAPPEETEHVESLRLLAALDVAAGDPVGARRMLERATRIAPDDAGAALDLARLERNQGRVEEASRVAARVLETRPDHVPTLRDLARSMGLLVRWTEAIDALRQARRVRPRDPAILDELGMALLQGAQWKNERMFEAGKVHDEALAISPGHVQNAYNLSRSLVKSNQTQSLIRAIALYEAAAKRIQALPLEMRKPGSYWFLLERDIHRNVGLVLSDSFKRWEEALVHYVAFFEMGGRPEDDPTGGILDEWGKVLRNLGQPYRDPPGPRWPR